MRFTRHVVFAILPVIFVLNGYSADILQFKSKIGFTRSEDMIVDHKLFDNDRKLLLIGKKYFQFWDLETATLLSSTPHQIPQFAPRGLVDKLLLGLPSALSWRPFLIDDAGKWLITVERTEGAEHRSAVVRDLNSARQLAVLDLPAISTDYVSLSADKREIVTFGKDGEASALASWDIDSFKLLRKVSIDEYRWHRSIKDGRKILVGSGDTKTIWIGPNIKQGERLTLRDGSTGAVEKEFTAEGLEPKSPFQDTAVTANEKYLISRRDGRILVWDIDGNGRPRFEIAPAGPKTPKPRLDALLDGRSMVVSLDKTVAVYDLAGNGTPRFVLGSGIERGIGLTETSADGRYLAVTDGSKITVLEASGNGSALYDIRWDSESERISPVGFIEGSRYFVVNRYARKVKDSGRTEFYDATGQMSITIPIPIGDKPRFMADGTVLYSENMRAAMLWNFTEKRSTVIPLKVGHSDPDPNAYYVQDDLDYSIEWALPSPDEKYVLRYGGKRVSVFDLRSGLEVQDIFDKEKVKYDKNNRVKKSGLGKAAWAAQGRVLYVFDEGGFFGITRTVSLWTRTI